MQAHTLGLNHSNLFLIKRLFIGLQPSDPDSLSLTVPLP